METIFPEINSDIFGVNISYDVDEVDDWFKRCLDDRPQILRLKSVNGWGGLMVQWVDKWFSQFIENHEDDEK